MFRGQIVWLIIWPILFEVCRVEGVAPSTSRVESKKLDSLSHDGSGEAKLSFGNLYFRLKRPFINHRTFAKKGEKFFKNDDYRGALRYYNEAITKKSSEISYYRTRGDCHSKLGNPDKAVADFREVVSKNPSSKDDRRALSRALYDAKLYTEAVNEMIAVDEFDGLLELGDKLLPKNEIEKALLCYTAAIKKSSSETEFLKLGNRLLSLGKFDEAISCYSEAIDNNQAPNASAYILRGKCYIEIKKFKEAILDYTKGIELDPDNEEWCYSFVRILFDSGKFDSGIENSLISMDNVVLMAILADELSFMEDCEKAIQYYNIIIEKKPLEASFYRKRGDCYARIDHFREAEIDLREAVKIDPSRKNILSLTKTLFKFEKYEEAIEETLAHNEIVELVKLGNIFFSIEKFDEAERCYIEAIKKDPSEISYYKFRGKFYTEMNDTDRAISDLEKVIQRNPKDEESCHFFIRALFHSENFNENVEKAFAIEDNTLLLTFLVDKFQTENKFNEAIRCYNAMIKRNSSKPSFYESRGNLYLRIGNYDDAIDDFKSAMRIDPTNKKYFHLLMQTLLDSERLNEAVKATLALDDIDEIVKLGNILMSKRRYENALNCYNAAIGKGSSEASYYKLRGKCSMHLKKMEEAIIDFRTYLGMKPYDTEIRLLLIQALFNFEEYDKAVDESLILNNINLFERLAERLCLEKRWKEAERCYTEAIRINPDSERYYQLRGHCCEQLEDSVAAVDDFKTALKINPQNKKIFKFLIKNLLDLERFEEAVKETLAFDDIDEVVNLAHKLFSLQRFKEAIDCYTVVIDKSVGPGNARYYTMRGLAHREMRNFELAINDFEKTLNIIKRTPLAGLPLTECQLDLAEVLLEINESSKAENVFNSIQTKYLNDERRARLENIRQKIFGNVETNEGTQPKEKLIISEDQSAKQEKPKEKDEE